MWRTDTRKDKGQKEVVKPYTHTLEWGRKNLEKKEKYSLAIFLELLGIFLIYLLSSHGEWRTHTNYKLMHLL